MGLIERYRGRLPVSAETPVVSLGEGSTPLLPAPRLSRRLGLELWLKWEGANPTGSYKDRGMTLAVSKALEARAQALICASTGNTAASAAAYGARAGLPVVVLQPAGAVAEGKLAQTRALGARVLEVAGDFDAALDAARELAARGTHALVNSLNPHRLEGQKTAVFELVEELGPEPVAVYLPYGGGGNTTAYARGLDELGLGGSVRLVAAQAADRPRTAASAIRIASPAHAERVAETEAEIATVDDGQILEAWRALAQEEGIFCEPASAAGLAALVAERPGGRAVCTLTGHGLKDPSYAARHAPAALTVEPDADAIAEAAQWS